ncbi:MAG TPA: hypothetical protein VFG02_00720, partial [Nitrospirota bacterium]|nr:hypothetical protein [Nitrospirota bacterium]
MKKYLSVVTAVLMLLSLCAPSAYATKNAVEPPKRIDLSQTLKYIQGWSARDKWDKFPESPSFAYYNTYSLMVLG